MNDSMDDSPRERRRDLAQPSPEIPGFRFPMSHRLFLMVARGMGVQPEHRVLDVCCQSGAALLLLAESVGTEGVGVDVDVEGLGVARSISQRLGLDSRLQFRKMDPFHLELPARSFDWILFLGGASSALNRYRALENAHVYLAPGGRVLLADPVYLDSDPPAEALQLVRTLKDPDGQALEPRSNRPADEVRIVLEEGQRTFETEAGYRAFLEALGFEVELSLLVPESEWGEYFARRAREAGGTDAPHHDADARTRAAQEAAAFYAFGGRGSVGYLVVGARLMQGSAGRVDSESR